MNTLGSLNDQTWFFYEICRHQKNVLVLRNLHLQYVVWRYCVGYKDDHCS